MVLYFYPKDDTPGCTVEAKEFTSLKQDYQAKGYQIIGVSRDSVDSHISFCKKQDLDLLLLSDTELVLSKEMGVIQEKLVDGKAVMGIARSTFVLDETGKVIREYRHVIPQGHALKLLEEI